jgi:hypothetical protein
VPVLKTLVLLLSLDREGVCSLVESPDEVLSTGATLVFCPLEIEKMQRSTTNSIHDLRINADFFIKLN